MIANGYVSLHYITMIEPHAGGVSTSIAMGVPSAEDFESLKHATLEIGDMPNAVTKAIDEHRLYIRQERPFYDPEFFGHFPVVVRFTGLLALNSFVSKITLRYRELCIRGDMEPAGFTHTYSLKVEGDQVVEFGHSMFGTPEIPEPRQNPWISDTWRNQAAEGGRILKASTGNQLELASGDLGTLCDRLLVLGS